MIPQIQHPHQQVPQVQQMSNQGQPQQVPSQLTPASGASGNTTYNGQSNNMMQPPIDPEKKKLIQQQVKSFILIIIHNVILYTQFLACSSFTCS